jgi:DNA-binding XRE family transcriptional regulator
MKITKEQCKGARAMLDLTREQLAAMSEISHRTIVDFERGARQPHKSTLTLLKSALEAAGIEFIDPNGGGPGLRLRE